MARIPRNLLVHLDEDDTRELFAWLSADPEVAFLWHAPGAELENLAVHDKVRSIPLTIESMDARDVLLRGCRWQAYKELPFMGDRTYLVWHIPSGLVMTQSFKRGDPPWVAVENPWLEWKVPTGGIADAPVFLEEPRFISLQIRTANEKVPSGVGISSISPQGMRWGAAQPAVRKYWRKLVKHVTRGAA